MYSRGPTHASHVWNTVLFLQPETEVTSTGSTIVMRGVGSVGAVVLGKVRAGVTMELSVASAGVTMELSVASVGSVGAAVLERVCAGVTMELSVASALLYIGCMEVYHDPMPCSSRVV